MSKEHLISNYYWEPPSVVIQMDVERMAGGRVRCRLYTNDRVRDGELASIPPVLHKMGFQSVYADVYEGHNVLMVSGLKHETALLHALQSNQLVQGNGKRMQAAMLPVNEGNVVKRALSTIQADTLKWSGRIGLSGHAAILADGILREKPSLAWGAAGALNPIILSIYGNGKGEIDFHEMMDKMRLYFEAEGIELPPEDRAKQRLSMLQSMDKMLASYPLQIGHALGSIGAVNLMKSGLSDMRAGNKKAINLFLAGTTSLVGNAAVIFIPETKKDKNTEEQTPMEQIKYGVTHLPEGLGFALNHPQQVPGKFWGFVKDSPLRFNGLLNLSDNVFWFIHAYGQKEIQQKHIAENGTKIDALQTQLDEALDELAHRRVRGKRVGKQLKNLLGIEEEITKLIEEKMFAQSRKGRISPYLSFVTAFSFGIATFLSAISSKNRSGDFLKDEMYEQMYASAAKILVQIPKDDRGDVLSRMATFLSSQEEVRDGDISADRIVEEINARMDVIERSPWLKRIQQQEQAPGQSERLVS